MATQVTAPGTLTFDYLSQTTLRTLLEDPAERAHLLGLSIMGQNLPGLPESLPDATPCQPVHMPVLATQAGQCQPGENHYQIWRSDAPLSIHREGALSCRYNADWLWASIALDIDMVNDPGLQAASHQAYRQIFALLDQLAFPYLLRAWNYFPEINHTLAGLERYRHFNIGRQEAFIGSNRNVTGNVPTACVLGSAHGPLSIAVLAGRQPLLALENPRQVSAYHYPQHYGPRSPTFSRAGLIFPAGQPLLLISGTASIVGHESMHLDDVVRQTEETLTNLGVLLEQANQALAIRKNPVRFTPADLCYTIYLRHPADYPKITALIRQFAGVHTPSVTVQADICRAALLVEIEATGYARAANTC